MELLHEQLQMLVDLSKEGVNLLVPLIASFLGDWLLVLILLGIIGWFLSPYLKYVYFSLRTRRILWQKLSMWGRRMSKRAKDQDVTDEIEKSLSMLVSRRKITRKDKRQYLRLLADALGMQDLKPRFPHPQALKNAIISRRGTASKELQIVAAVPLPDTKEPKKRTRNLTLAKSS